MRAPGIAEWIAVALVRRARDLGVIGTCSSSRCMCSPDNEGCPHAADCHCHDRKHAMLEMAKINNRFAAEVKKAMDATP